MSQTMKVKTIMIDDQSGGYNMTIYNNEEELVKDQLEDDASEEQIRELLDGEDEYENGYIEDATIEVETDSDGTIRLAKPISFHAGQ